jgi:hypothetical protein
MMRRLTRARFPSFHPRNQRSQQGPKSEQARSESNQKKYKEHQERSIKTTVDAIDETVSNSSAVRNHTVQKY